MTLSAIQNEETVAQLAAKYEVHPTMFNNWKKALLEGAADLFDKGQKARKHHNATVNELYKKIGQLKVENGFLSKGLGL
ncbi:hypothetical protein CSA57_14530 [candidate division KSB3 bacterium]|nr:MAG: hypothetical protein CSA57_14530 [candidate division KSB3 bacterium]